MKNGFKKYINEMQENRYNNIKNKIIEILMKNNNILISHLAKKLNLSFVTTHKYIELLEKDRIIKSIYEGGQRIIILIKSKK